MHTQPPLCCCKQCPETPPPPPLSLLPLPGLPWLLQFFVDTEVELKHPRPNGFPASGIWGYRVANVALNALNYFWFCKMATKAMQLLAPAKKRSKGRKGR